MAEKTYHWLKLQEDFFSSKRIKKLRKLAGGDTFVIIYLKMQLLSVRNKGVLTYSGLEQSFAEELALDLDEDVENVALVLQYLSATGLIETSDDVEYLLPYAAENIGYKNDSSGIEAKTNAERQRSHKAKEKSLKNGNVPMIEDYANKKRYSGNYYVCFSRDKFECAICGSKENLCLHHIDGFYEDCPENNAENKMVTLCRKCHSKIHAGNKIPENVLARIGYYDGEGGNESNESNGLTRDLPLPLPLPSNSVSDTINNNSNNINNNSNRECAHAKEKSDAEPVALKRPPTPPVLTKEDISRVMEAWNGLGLNTLISINTDSERYKLLKGRVKQYGIERIIEGIKSISNQPFLLGHNNRGWTITFDWFVKPNNCPKVLEGNYVQSKSKGGNKLEERINDVINSMWEDF